MYTSKCTPEREDRLPEGYDGTLLREDTPDGREDVEDGASVPTSMPASSNPLLGILPKGLDGLFNLPFLKGWSIGIEEILIGATALFLLASPSGDKECAVMLILLLFVK